MRIEVFTLQSIYRIQLAIPMHAPIPAAGWPSITILGDDAFATACASMRYHLDCRPPGYLDAGVLISVAYTGENRRQFDYTPIPQHSTHDPGHTYGGAEAFHHFLVHTLRPALQARWRLDPARQALMGHSLGGLFTLHTLMTHTASFQTYIASSPSVWWNDRYLVRSACEYAKADTKLYAPVAVQMSVGEYEQTLSPLEQTRPNAAYLTQIRQQRAMVDGNRRIAHMLAACRHIQLSFQVYSGHYHRSVWPSAMNLGLLTALQTR